MTRDHATAAHEAAHVVVGVALGLRLKLATLTRQDARGWQMDASTWFSAPPRGWRTRREAWALMLAAGPAWDRHAGNPLWWSAADRHELRRLAAGRHGVATYVTAAAAILAGRRAAHRRVTTALLERDMRGADVAALARGEALEA